MFFFFLNLYFSQWNDLLDYVSMLWIQPLIVHGLVVREYVLHSSPVSETGSKHQNYVAII